MSPVGIRCVMTKFLLYLSGIKTFLIGGALVAGLVAGGVAFGIKKHKEHKYKREIEKAKIEFTRCVSEAKTNSELQNCYFRS